MPEKLVPLSRPGEMVNLAVTPRDFFSKRVVRKADGPVDASGADFETYAEAGYRLGDYYEDMTPYDGPKTQRAYEHQQDERRAERAAARSAEAQPARAEAPKAEAKKD